MVKKRQAKSLSLFLTEKKAVSVNICHYEKATSISK